jgi:hypothetical protein
VLWTLLVPLPGMVLTGLFTSIVPQIHTVRISVHLAPASAAFRNVEVTSVAAGTSAFPLPHRLNLDLHRGRPGPVPSATFVPPDRFGDRTVDGADALAGAIADWWSRLGIPLNDQTTAEADELAAHLMTASKGTNLQQLSLLAYTQNGSSMSRSARPQYWPVVAGILMTVAVWVWGVWRIRRGLRPGTHSNQTAPVASV